MAITLTQAAVERVRSQLRKRGHGVGLRLGVRPSGCSGMSYVVDFADEVAATDRVFEDQGVTVVVASDAVPYLEGTELDYVREGLNESFRFRNPNVADECGCGESFNIRPA